ncbi:MAG: DUF1667 domain-containing protein [Lentisphaerae bacterium]|nr:DUF1667 domain-containing protein [Lentisphaerota bacterium]
MTELICINCPQGCHLQVSPKGDSWLISGNRCPKGVAYGQQEMRDPRRTVTAVMPCENPEHPLVAVRTDRPCPKAMIPAILNRIYHSYAEKNVKNGDIVLKNIDNSEISVIVTENI